MERRVSAVGQDTPADLCCHVAEILPHPVLLLPHDRLLEALSPFLDVATFGQPGAIVSTYQNELWLGNSGVRRTT